MQIDMRELPRKLTAYPIHQPKLKKTDWRDEV